MKFPCIKLSRAFPRGQRCPARSRHLPRIPSLDAANRTRVYDAIFHTIILHIIGLLNHPRRGDRARCEGIPPCSAHLNRSRSAKLATNWSGFLECTHPRSRNDRRPKEFSSCQMIFPLHVPSTFVADLHARLPPWRIRKPSSTRDDRVN